MKRVLIVIVVLCAIHSVQALGKFGDWTFSVALTGYVSDETGKAPNAFLWIQEGCEHVNFAVLAQQNMTKEALLRNPRFRQKIAKLGGECSSGWLLGSRRTGVPRQAASRRSRR